MNWFQRKFKPTSAWESVARELGGQYVPGKFLANGQINFVHGAYTITVCVPCGNSVGEDRSSTKVSTQARLNPEAKIALLRKWPGQSFFTRFISMTGKGSELPILDNMALPFLGAECMVIAQDSEIAKQVFGDQKFVEAFGIAPERLHIRIGGSFQEWNKANDGELALFTPKVLTDSRQIANLLELMRDLLDALQRADCIEG